MEITGCALTDRLGPWSLQSWDLLCQRRGMFVAQEITLKLGCRAAQARLLVLTAGDWLRAGSGDLPGGHGAAPTRAGRLCRPPAGEGELLRRRLEFGLRSRGCENEEKSSEPLTSFAHGRYIRRGARWQHQMARQDPSHGRNNRWTRSARSGPRGFACPPMTTRATARGSGRARASSVRRVRGASAWTAATLIAGLAAAAGYFAHHPQPTVAATITVTPGAPGNASAASGASRSCRRQWRPPAVQQSVKGTAGGTTDAPASG